MLVKSVLKILVELRNVLEILERFHFVQMLGVKLSSVAISSLVGKASFADHLRQSEFVR